jgi:hypothetical protein
MANLRFLSRLALVLVFVAGAWEDILPGIEDLDIGPWSVPADELPSSDADEDAGDGFVLTQVPPENVLLAESAVAFSVPLAIRLVAHDEQFALLPLFVQRILHVPIAL